MSDERTRLAMKELLRVLDALDRCPRCVLDADGCHGKRWRKAYDEAKNAVRDAVRDGEKKPN